ncbi:aldehyde dehydrogenase family protein, partial [Vibrio parahaemolyticus VPTS-2010]
LRVMQ